MIKKKMKCFDCSHWKQTGLEPYQGYCIVSGECANAVMHGRPPTRFLSKDEIKPISEIILKGGENRTKGTGMSNEDLVKAKQMRQRQNPVRPDIRTLTEESKKMLRERKVTG